MIASYKSLVKSAFFHDPAARVVDVRIGAAGQEEWVTPKTHEIAPLRQAIA